jgi:FkbM family methyltransferase
MARIQQFLKAQALKRLPDSLLAHLKRRHYESVLRNFDENQEPDLTVVRHLVPSGATAVDLGANIGVYTKVLSSLAGADGRVISVEPIPPTFRILVRNCRALRMANVELVNAAVSDRRRELVMEVPDYDSGGENFYMAKVVGQEPEPRRAARRRRFPVQARPLDDIVSGVERLAFVKCDVEGYELQCLAGAGTVLARQQAAWLVEVAGDPDRAGSSAAEVFALFKAHGYEGWFFDGHQLINRRHGDQRINYFFLTDKHVSGLRNAHPELLT